jgi:hypothetical protein
MDDKNNRTPNGNSSAPRLLLFRLSTHNDPASNSGLPEAYEKLASRGYDLYVLQPWTEASPPDAKIAIQTIVALVKEQVLKNGSFSELRFAGHGNTDLLFIDNLPFKASDLLSALSDLKKELSRPIADKIIFDSCSVFKELTPSQVKKFRQLSRALDTEIVGNRDLALTSLVNDRISFKKGDVGYFTASDIESDEEINITLGITTVFDNIANRGRLNANNVWIDCHTAASQERGELCQNIRQPIEEIAGKTPLALLTPIGKKVWRHLSESDAYLLPKEVLALQKRLDPEISRLFNKSPAPDESAGSSFKGKAMLLSGKQMSERAEDFLAAAGLGERDKHGKNAADYLRDPKTRDDYMKVLNDAYDGEKDANRRIALGKLYHAAQDFLKMDKAAEAMKKVDINKKTESNSPEILSPYASATPQMQQQKREGGNLIS